MEHSPGFLKLVNEARPYVREIGLDEARQRLATHPQTILLDVREDSEWKNGHAAEAMHLGRGVLERDLERLVPDPKRELIMYCGGGYRSILAAASAQRMGYHSALSLKGGYKAMVTAGWPMKTGD